jgi:hypothetical protein
VPLEQQRFNLEMINNQTLANVVQAWEQLDAGKAQVTAAEVTLNGVREEARAGQRTTLDLLNAQQALVDARVALMIAQHDRVVASYSVLSAVGRLSPRVLGLPIVVPALSVRPRVGDFDPSASTSAADQADGFRPIQSWLDVRKGRQDEHGKTACSGKSGESRSSGEPRREPCTGFAGSM